MGTLAGVSVLTHTVYIDTFIPAHIQALPFWVHMYLACVSMHSFTSQAYSSPSPGNYGNGDYI